MDPKYLFYIAHALTSTATENCLLSPLHRAKGLTPMLSLDGRGDALAVAHAASWRTDVWASTDLGTTNPCMPQDLCQQILSLCPVPPVLSWGQQAESWRDTARREADSHCEHLLCQGAEEMLLQRRRASNHQIRGTISRCWRNVSPPTTGKGTYRHNGRVTL